MFGNLIPEKVINSTILVRNSSGKTGRMPARSKKLILANNTSCASMHKTGGYKNSL